MAVQSSVRFLTGCHKRVFNSDFGAPTLQLVRLPQARVHHADCADDARSIDEDTLAQLRNVGTRVRKSAFFVSLNPPTQTLTLRRLHASLPSNTL